MLKANQNLLVHQQDLNNHFFTHKNSIGRNIMTIVDTALGNTTDEMPREEIRNLLEFSKLIYEAEIKDLKLNKPPD